MGNDGRAPMALSSPVCNHSRARFSVDDISARVKLKSSVGRALQRDIVEIYPVMEPYIENLISKKAELVEARW